QEGLLGLKVTRKVFVPRDGYFVRFLEELQNDGADPVTVDVSIDSTLESFWATHGAGIPGLLDQVSPGYVVVDDTETRDFYDFGSQIPPLAIAFADSTAAAPEVQLSDYALRYRWAAVEVPAHGRTLLMHVWTAQADRDRAQASGARLASLPPE